MHKAVTMTEKQTPEMRDITTSGGNYCERVERHHIVAETVNIYETAPNSTAPSINNGKVTASQKQLAFAIAGSIKDVDQAKLKAILALLQKISGDATIEIIRVEEGSIRIILNGSDEGLERINELVESGELTEVLGTSVEYAQFVDRESLGDIEETELNNKSRLFPETISQEVRGLNLSVLELEDINSTQDSLFEIEQKTYVTQDRNPVIVLTPSGMLNNLFYLTLQKYISELGHNIVVNFAQVHFLDSSGLVYLLKGMQYANKVNGSIRICNVNSAVRLIFELTQMDKVFEIFETQEEALNSLKVIASSEQQTRSR